MSDEMYVNKNGFKCLMSSLQKTDGIDPQEYHRAKMIHGEDTPEFKNALKTLRVRVPKYAEVQ